MGITLRRAADRGRTRLDWLDSRHTFSFGDYHDDEHMGFGPLRVINEDRVEPGRGFATHGHRDMEIITYVLDGALEHRDSLGTGSVIRPGEVQIMSAGTGITHSEFNHSTTEPVHFLQIRIVPAERGIAPRYDQRAFDPAELQGRLRPVVAPGGSDGALPIHQEARMLAGRLGAGERVVHRVDRSMWMQVARGALTVNGTPAEAGDGVAIVAEPTVTLQADDAAELLLFDL